MILYLFTLEILNMYIVALYVKLASDNGLFLHLTDINRMSWKSDRESATRFWFKDGENNQKIYTEKEGEEYMLHLEKINEKLFIRNDHGKILTTLEDGKIGLANMNEKYNQEITIVDDKGNPIDDEEEVIILDDEDDAKKKNNNHEDDISEVVEDESEKPLHDKVLNILDDVDKSDSKNYKISHNIKDKIITTTVSETVSTVWSVLTSTVSKIMTETVVEQLKTQEKKMYCIASSIVECSNGKPLDEIQKDYDRLRQITVSVTQPSTTLKDNEQTENTTDCDKKKSQEGDIKQQESNSNTSHDKVSSQQQISEKPLKITANTVVNPMIQSTQGKQQFTQVNPYTQVRQPQYVRQPPKARQPQYVRQPQQVKEYKQFL